MNRAATLIIALGLAGMTAWGQTPPAAQNIEWRHYGRDLAHTRYAPIDQMS